MRYSQLRIFDSVLHDLCIRVPWSCLSKKEMLIVLSLPTVKKWRISCCGLVALFSTLQFAHFITHCIFCATCFLSFPILLNKHGEPLRDFFFCVQRNLKKFRDIFEYICLIDRFIGCSWDYKKWFRLVINKIRDFFYILNRIAHRYIYDIYVGGVWYTGHLSNQCE